MTHQSDQSSGINFETGKHKASLPNSSYKSPLHLQQQSSQYRCKKNHVLLPNHHQHNQQQQRQGDYALTKRAGNEIKRLQDLLEEKNDSLTSLSLENVDTCQEINRLTNQFRQSSDALERSKEEIWALELEKQELIQQITDLQQQAKRASVDHTRLIRHEQHLKQELDNMKQQQVAWQDSLEKAKLDKLDLAVTRRKISALERQLSENDILVDVSHSSKDSDVEGNTNTFLMRRNSPPSPTPSQSLPLASFTKKPRHHRQQYDHLMVLNAELHTSLTTANDTIKKLQCTLENEKKKRMEMEMLWREAQETIEKSDNDRDLSIATSTEDTSKPPYFGSANNDYDNDCQQQRKQQQQQFGSVFNVHSGGRKESRQIRNKTLSLGEELILADTSDETTGTLLATSDTSNTQSNYKDISTIAPWALGASWISEQVSTHTNLDEIIGTGQLQHTSTDHTWTNSEIGAKASTASSIEQQQQCMQDANGNNGDVNAHNGDSDSTIKGHRQPERYGSLTTVESSFYQTSSSEPALPQQHEQHANDDSDNNNISDTSATESSDNQQNGTGYIRALTRTMIGDWMWKYTRKVVGAGISEYKHKRFCWLHPYSKTLFWSAQEPGTDGCEYVTKYVMMESFKVIDNGGVLCFLIQTQGRSLKIQCKDNATYTIWRKSLKHLLIDVPPIISLATTKTTNEGTRRLNSPPNHCQTPNFTVEKHHITYDVSAHYHCLNKQQENWGKSSSPSSSTQYITMSGITPASPSWYLDSAMSSATITGSSSISLPSSPQKRVSPTARHHHLCFSADSGSKFNE